MQRHCRNLTTTLFCLLPVVGNAFSVVPVSLQQPATSSSTLCKPTTTSLSVALPTGFAHAPVQEDVVSIILTSAVVSFGTSWLGMVLLDFVLRRVRYPGMGMIKDDGSDNNDTSHLLVPATASDAAASSSLPAPSSRSPPPFSTNLASSTQRRLMNVNRRGHHRKPSSSPSSSSSTRSASPIGQQGGQQRRLLEGEITSLPAAAAAAAADNSSKGNRLDERGMDRITRLWWQGTRHHQQDGQEGEDLGDENTTTMDSNKGGDDLRDAGHGRNRRRSWLRRLRP